MKKDYNIEIEKNYFAEIAKNFMHKDFRWDKFSTEIVENFIKYANNDHIHNENEQSFKGLLVAGLPGCGKTLLFKIFREYCLNRATEKKFRIFSVNEIIDMYTNNGSACFNLFLQKQKIYNNGISDSKHINICIDDTGIEQDSVQHFGTVENVIHKLLYGRYELLDQGVITHMITNLDGDQLEEKYGQRLYSRFKEMFLYFHYDGPDRRQ